MEGDLQSEIGFDGPEGLLLSFAPWKFSPDCLQFYICENLLQWANSELVYVVHTVEN